MKNQRSGFIPYSCYWLVSVTVAFLAIAPTNAMKHNYYTRRDERSLIGPIGFPFGFLDTGHYSITVFDFQLTPTKKAHKHDSHSHTRSLTAVTQSDLLKNIKGVGFLLKQFKDEASFHRYMAFIQEDPSLCIFQKYLDYDYDDDAFDFMDDYKSEGLGEVIDVAEDGIYLNMLPQENWAPNTVSAAYDFQSGEAGFYFLIYQVCYNEDVKGANDIFDIHSRFELDFHFSNKDMFNHISYLSSGEMLLPWIFFVFALMYAICLYIWNANIKLIKDGKSGYFDTGDVLSIAPPAIPGGSTAFTDTPTIYPIHYLMGLLLGLKFCALFFESIRFLYFRLTGHAVFFSAVYYIFAFLKGMTLFTVIALIGSGWSFVKPCLTDREKKMILGLLVLQVVNNIAIVFLTQETEGEISFDRWTAILHLVDIICCCAILVPIVWQVNELEKKIEQSQHKGKNDDEAGNLESESASFINGNNDQFHDDDGRIPEDELDDTPTDTEEGSSTAIPDQRMVSRLKLFRSFYLLVIAYIYMTRIVVYLFAATLNYKHTWIPPFVVELTTIVFYAGVGYMFRPMNDNPYLDVEKQRHATATQVEMHRIDPRTKTALD